MLVNILSLQYLRVIVRINLKSFLIICEGESQNFYLQMLILQSEIQVEIMNAFGLYNGDIVGVSETGRNVPH